MRSVLDEQPAPTRARTAGASMSDGEPPQRHLRLVKTDRAEKPPPAPPSAPMFAPGNFTGMFNLSGRVALIVGGGGGIGGAIAHALADHGARIVVADLNVEAA